MCGIASSLIPFIYLRAVPCLPPLGSPYFLSLQPMTACLSRLHQYSTATVRPGRAARAALQVWRTERSFKSRSNFCPDHHITTIITPSCHKRRGRRGPAGFPSPREEEEWRPNCASKLSMLLKLWKASTATQKEVWLLPAVKWRYLEFTDARFPLGNKRFPSVTATDFSAAGRCEGQKVTDPNNEGQSHHFSSQLSPTLMESTSLTAPKITIFSSRAGQRQLRCILPPAWDAADCVCIKFVSIILSLHGPSCWDSQQTGPPMSEVTPAPSRMWAGNTIPVKHRLWRASSVTSPGGTQARGFPALWLQPHANGNSFLWNTISSAGRRWHQNWT